MATVPTILLQFLLFALLGVRSQGSIVEIQKDARQSWDSALEQHYSAGTNNIGTEANQHQRLLRAAHEFGNVLMNHDQQQQHGVGQVEF